MSDAPLRIAVTGGSGGVGRYVVRYLCERGHTVINIDRKAAPDLPARFVYMDVRRRELLQPVLEQVDAVVHLGEIPHAGVLPHDETFAHNVACGSTVLQTAADLKLRHVIYTSTCQVYGPWGGPLVAPVTLPMDEDHPVQPQNTYALSKVANESYCRWVSRDSGLRVSVFRLPWVVRSEEHTIRWLERDRGQRTHEGFGTYVHGQDVARAFEAALLRNLEGCRTYHLVANDVMTRQPVREMLETTYPDYPKLPADWPPYKAPVTCERARQELGWEPQWSVREEFARRIGRPLEEA